MRKRVWPTPQRDGIKYCDNYVSSMVGSYGRYPGKKMIRQNTNQPNSFSQPTDGFAVSIPKINQIIFAQLFISNTACELSESMLVGCTFYLPLKLQSGLLPWRVKQWEWRHRQRREGQLPHIWHSQTEAQRSPVGQVRVGTRTTACGGRGMEEVCEIEHG